MLLSILKFPVNLSIKTHSTVIKSYFYSFLGTVISIYCFCFPIAPPLLSRSPPFPTLVLTFYWVLSVTEINSYPKLDQAYLLTSSRGHLIGLEIGPVTVLPEDFLNWSWGT